MGGRCRHGGADLRGLQPEGAIFVKDLVYKSRSPVGLNNAFRLIKELQWQYKTCEAEVKELKNFVEQEDLVLNRSKTQIRINDPYIRPPLGARGVCMRPGWRGLVVLT